MCTKKLNILVSTVESYGHLNTSMGIATKLKKRGHNIIYAMTKEWKERIENNGFKFAVVDFPLEKSSLKDYNAEELINRLLDNQIESFRKPLLEACMDTFSETIIAESCIEINYGLKEIINDIRPDLIIVDAILPITSIIKCGIPWVNICSCNPSLIYGRKLPPPGSGLPSNENYDELWEKYLKIVEKKEIFAIINKHCMDVGLNINVNSFLYPSQWMNLYIFPKILDYSEVPKKKYNNFFRIDASIRECKEDFHLPECLRKSTQPLIYFSLGSIGSAYVEFMKKTLSILSCTPYRYIISKGPRHEQIDLYENMWGEKYVNQLAILPLVDLVIHHGGSNTTIECLYFGKPAIVIPLFYDQLNNAQRIEEKHLGIRVDGVRIEDDEYKSQLLNAIETLLNDKDLKQKLQGVSKEIQESTSLDNACELLEKLAIEKKPLCFD